MSTTDFRFKRMNDKAGSRRNAQYKAESFEKKVQELKNALQCNNDMLDAIIKHLGVPYKKPAGFITKR
ncbi:MAG: hypothetical protein J4G18_18660 [Anaerolineae bacterium]|nr:hypothetical protein [Anaerolineae bacterium]